MSKIIDRGKVVPFDELYERCGEDGQTQEEFAQVLGELVDLLSPVEGFSHLQIVSLSDEPDKLLS
jgi:hypothetical protein